ncbi:glycosyltransferase family 4 protein [Pontibacter qinzhouensis]|uniref:Glycosyltransferase family 4 protein n=1 Tax=Pontibacter qinzhouensis TaxID=2603253 RepID=A0A5C8KAJ8_9BACT|nr:glycosyltransferase family 4 protein [Pontibacter qinzhouensis]TXK46971.1 glycosyltransferase family 4 protein [Pontibacter qinzhouensis]
MKINFITNLSLNETSGGGSAVNAATYQQLSRFFDVNYCGPINLPIDTASKFTSKLNRSIGLPGNYHFFSDNRLKQIAAKVAAVNKNDSDANFFHGFTSWIKYKSSLPYYAYADACFATYVSIYNKGIKFSGSDLERIYAAEAKWLDAASQIFFRSKWALNETKKHYGLDGHNFSVAGLGGFIDIPESFQKIVDFQFLFISKEFIPKGGDLCVKAFERLREYYPNATMIIVGEEPPKDILVKKNVEYAGFLSKSKPEEYEKLKCIFSNSFALVHPTSKDTNALVISEAGYYGCPSIAPASFAIPELIKNNITGLLLHTPISVDDVYEKMSYLCSQPSKYLKMRESVRQFSISNFTWEKVGEHFFKTIIK